MNIKHTICLGLTLSVISLPVFASERGDLTGVGLVKLVVEDVDADAAADGLNIAAITKELHHKLANSHIKESSNAKCVLSVSFNTQKTNIDTYAFDAEVKLIEAVVTTGRKRRNAVLATTWSAAVIGEVPSASISSAGIGVGTAMDLFIEDYQSEHNK